MKRSDAIRKMVLPLELKELINREKMEIIVPESRAQLLELATEGSQNMTYDVEFEVEGRGTVREASVTRCRNGLVANYDDIYMRRRDPDCMFIADDLPTDRETHEQRFGVRFEDIRAETFKWLGDRDKLLIMPFYAGNESMGLCYPALLVLPGNAAFFALALADLQGFTPITKIPNFFKPKAVVYVAPPFRHTHYNGKQVVIHNRQFEMHEVFSYNLYPGPSAKKGIYSVLLNIGEQEKWVTVHASTVKTVTPYELTLVIMHEGASGGGKSEMLEQFHRDELGRVRLGTNMLTGESFTLNVNDACQLHPVTDDMAMCHPSIQNSSGKLVVADAENGWFVRVDHITKYGTEPDIERNTIHPKEPLLFINIDAMPGSTCLIWEHIEDSPGKKCTNPRVILPRSDVNNVVDGSVEVDIRSFGFRQPFTTREHPNFGIAGLFHVLPPALAWLWRLTAPRGLNNPSITDTTGMQSEGVGSYWPFATGKIVDQANLLLSQFEKTPMTKYVLIPVQHIGVYKVGFSGEWVTREYLSRRGGVNFRPESLVEARCPLLGYALNSIKIDGVPVSKTFLQVNLQPEVGNEGYDEGAKMLNAFFKQELKKFLTADLAPLGKRIIEACMSDGSVEDYKSLL